MAAEEELVGVSFLINMIVLTSYSHSHVPSQTQILSVSLSLLLAHTHIRYIQYMAAIQSMMECSYDPCLGGATAWPVGAKTEDQKKDEQQGDEGHYGDEACVGERGRVRPLCWDHVGQVQHVAQRPASVTP